MNMSKQQLTDDDVRIIAMYALENSEVNVSSEISFQFVHRECFLPF